MSVEGACCPTKVLSLEGGGPEKTAMDGYLWKGSETLPTRIVEGAGCLSKVLALECGGQEKTPMNGCLRKCSEAWPKDALLRGRRLRRGGR